MGQIFRACLKKELLEQQFHALFMINAVPIALTVGALLLDALDIHVNMLSMSDLDFVEKTAIFTMFAAVLAMGTDLTGGEWKRSGINFLNRIPLSIRTVFSAKLLIMFLLTMYSFLCGLVVSCAIYFINQTGNFSNDLERFLGDVHIRISAFLSNWQVPVFTFLFACFLLITLTCWVRRTGLSLFIWGIIISVFLYVYRLLDNWAIAGHFLYTENSPNMIDQFLATARCQAVNIFLITSTLCMLLLAYYSFARGFHCTVPTKHADQH